MIRFLQASGHNILSLNQYIILFYVCMCYCLKTSCIVSACMLSRFSCVWLLATLWTIAHQVPLSVGFSGQEYWSGLPWPPPGDLPNPGIEPGSVASPTLAGRFFTTSGTWEISEDILFNIYCWFINYKLTANSTRIYVWMMLSNICIFSIRYITAFWCLGILALQHYAWGSF